MSSQRDRAEAAFGHLRHAAREVILAAHDGLDLLDEVVATTDMGGIIERLNQVGETIVKRTRPEPDAPFAGDGGPSSPPAPGPAARPPPAPDSSAPHTRNRVERIPVR